LGHFGGGGKIEIFDHRGVVRYKSWGQTAATLRRNRLWMIKSLILRLNSFKIVNF